MTIIVAIIGLIFLIAIHEFGHMLTAKAFGVRVPEYAIGFGPALFKKKFGETTYSFRIILLGGFARIAGMGGDDGSATGMERDGDGPRRMDGRPLDEEPAPDTYYAKPLWKRALIIFAGPAVNIAFAALLLAALYTVQGVPTQSVDELDPVVRITTEDSLAEEVGVRPGDRMVAVDGESVGSWEGFTRAVENKEPGDEVSLTIERDGERRTLSGELGSAPGDPERPLVGISPEVGDISHSPLLGIWAGIEQTGRIIWLQLWGLYSVLTGQLDFFDNVTGPVGNVAIGSEIISAGVVQAVSLLAIISAVLGVMNLLPILPLDGGHLLFIAAEKIKGRPISEETMGKVALVGLMLVLALMLFATYADLSKIFTGQPFIPER
ncbi:MAG: M50 family metallopeptidase [Rubrobacteraceae bacterium]